MFINNFSFNSLESFIRIDMMTKSEIANTEKNKYYMCAPFETRCNDI